jgi:hypothetical protein
LLEVLDDIAETLEAVGCRVHCTNLAAPRGNDKERGALKEQNLFRHDLFTQFAQMVLDLVEVGDEIMDDFGPRLVEGLVPNRRSKRDRSESFGLGSDKSNTLVVDIFTLRGYDQIHLMNEYVNTGGGRKLAECSDDRSVCKEVAVEVSGFDIEDIYEHTDVGEDMLALLREVVFHESILSGRSQLWFCGSDDMACSNACRAKLYMALESAILQGGYVATWLRPGNSSCLCLQARLREVFVQQICRRIGNSPATVPQIEGQIAKELDRTKVDINRSSQASGVLCDVVGEDDAPHRALA